MQLADQPNPGLTSTAGGPTFRLAGGCTECERLLRAGAVVPRNGAGSASQAKGWTETLGRVIADLEFIEALSLISSELIALATLISEERGLCIPGAYTRHRSFYRDGRAFRSRPRHPRAGHK